MNLSCSEGSRVLIELNNLELVEGDLLRKSEDRIDVGNITLYQTGNKVDSVWSFYNKEIRRVRVLKRKELFNLQLEDNESDITLPKEEYDRLKELSERYVYFTSVDKNYHDAVHTINNYESIGVFAVGSQKGRSGHITLLAISTWQHTYIFDFKLYRETKFLTELKHILESSYITKIVHGGGPLTDCLIHSHGVYIRNVFDTQVSDLILTKNEREVCGEKLLSISECLTKYFNFPSALLESSLRSLEESWEERPLEDDKILKVSKLATYLITLKDHLQSLMLKDFQEAVNNVHDLYVTSSPYNSLQLAKSTVCSKEIDLLIPGELLSKKTHS